jgi:hypothetical protein
MEEEVKRRASEGDQGLSEQVVELARSNTSALRRRLSDTVEAVRFSNESDESEQTGGKSEGQPIAAIANKQNDNNTTSQVVESAPRGSSAKRGARSILRRWSRGSSSGARGSNPSIYEGAAEV